MFRLWAYYGMMMQIPLSLLTDYVVKGGRAGNVVRVWEFLGPGQIFDWYCETDYWENR